jgi:hypothetical protein
VQAPACLAVLPALGGPAVTVEEARGKLDGLTFEDGSTHPVCTSARAFAFTKVNGSTVWVCPQAYPRLKEIEARAC